MELWMLIFGGAVVCGVALGLTFSLVFLKKSSSNINTGQQQQTTSSPQPSAQPTPATPAGNSAAPSPAGNQSPSPQATGASLTWRLLRNLIILALLVSGGWWAWANWSTLSTAVERMLSDREDSAAAPVAPADDATSETAAPAAVEDLEYPILDSMGTWFDNQWDTYVMGTWYETPLVVVHELIGEIAAAAGVSPLPVYIGSYLIISIILWLLLVRPLWKMTRQLLAGQTMLAPTMVIIGTLALAYYTYQTARDSALATNPAAARANATEVHINGDTLATGDHIYNIAWNQVLVFDPPNVAGVNRCYEYDIHSNDPWNESFTTPDTRRAYLVPDARSSERILFIWPSHERVDRLEFTTEFMAELQRRGMPYRFHIVVNRNC
jgi:hypothetical protein